VALYRGEERRGGVCHELDERTLRITRAQSRHRCEYAGGADTVTTYARQLLRSQEAVYEFTAFEREVGWPKREAIELNDA
jgi:hypothetical protein